MLTWSFANLWWSSFMTQGHTNNPQWSCSYYSFTDRTRFEDCKVMQGLFLARIILNACTDPAPTSVSLVNRLGDSLNRGTPLSWSFSSFFFAHTLLGGFSGVLDLVWLWRLKLPGGSKDGGRENLLRFCSLLHKNLCCYWLADKIIFLGQRLQ